MHVLDYSKSLFHFVGTREHFIKNVKYNINVFEDFLVIGQKFESQSPKYKIVYSSKIQIQFTTDPSVNKGIKITAFAFKYLDKYKSIVADHQNIVRMKNILSGQVTFFKIADFYEPQYIIGKGSSARVLLVQKLHSEEKYAVKSIDKAYLFKSENGMQAFELEVKILKLLSNTHTEDQKSFLKLYEIFEGTLTYYLVVELLKGKTLQDELDFLKSRQQRSVMSAQSIQIIMKRLLEGVQVMQYNNIIHRDLKPDNIMFAVQGDYSTLRIVDFGLATETSAEKYMFPKCGTPGYVAPEILNLSNRSSKYSSISDMFSCGCIFYKLLMGRSLFQGSQFNDVLKLNKACDIDLSNNQEIKKLDKNSQNLLFCLLQKDPNKRINVHDALNHPYFSQTNQITSDSLISTDNSSAVKLSSSVQKNVDKQDDGCSPFHRNNASKCFFNSQLQQVLEEHKAEEDSIMDSLKNDNFNEISHSSMNEFYNDQHHHIHRLPYIKISRLKNTPNLFFDMNTLIINQAYKSATMLAKISLSEDAEQIEQFQPKAQHMFSSPMNSSIIQVSNSMNSFYMKEPLSPLKRQRFARNSKNQTILLPIIDGFEGEEREEIQRSKMTKVTKFMEKLSLFDRSKQNQEQEPY